MGSTRVLGTGAFATLLLVVAAVVWLGLRRP